MGTKKSKFDQLVQELKKWALELNKLEKPHKCTAKAFLADAISNARTDLSRLKALRERIESDPTFKGCQVFLRNSTQYLRSPNVVCVTSRLDRLRFLGREDEYMAELGILGSNVLELYALGVLIATERYPEAFGDIPDWAAHVKATQEAKAKLEELCKRVEASWAPEDVVMSPVVGGFSRITYRCTGSEVVVGPGSGRKLADWLISHKEV